MMPRRLEYDWFPGTISDNIVMGTDVYVDSAFGLVSFFSERNPGMRMGRASGLYDRATIISGPEGVTEIGEFVCLNGTYLICNREITIGSYALLSWGCVITDTSPDADATIADRRRALESASRDSRRILPPVSPPRPVIIEENVWAGFDSVILPGVRIGRGSIIGCKTIVTADVPPYSVIAGNPARHLRSLEPDETEECRAEAFASCMRGVHE
jgi:acetyltransferase-like isoleucine patch superfamily enzyme